MATLFAALASWLTFPLVLSLATHVTGDGPGDNLCFLWNTWWFRRALLQQASLGFWSDALFAPAGTSLVLHTHTFLQAAVGAAMLPTAGVTFAHNVVLLIGLAANGWAAYALCFHYSRQSLASLAGGVAFASSTYVLVHVLGHVNLVNAWVIPLFALMLGRFMERPSALRAGLAGVALAAVSIRLLPRAVLRGLRWPRARGDLPGGGRHHSERPLAPCHADLARPGRLPGHVRRRRGGNRRRRRHARLDSHLDSKHTEYRRRCRGTAARRDRVCDMRCGSPWSAPPKGSDLRREALARRRGECGRPARSAGASFGLALILQGDYVSPIIPWRSSPAGIDVATLVLGPPRHLVTGLWTQQAYGRFGINLIGQLMIGVVPAIAMVLTLRHVRVQKDLRLWLLTAATFLVCRWGPSCGCWALTRGFRFPSR